MKINKYTYLVLGFAALFGIFIFSSQVSGFSADTNVLNMEIPMKEGYNANPTFTLTTDYPTVPDQLGIYSMETPAVNAESTKKLAESKLKKKASAPNVVEDETSYSVVTSESYVSVDKKSGAETVILDVPGLSASRKNGLPSEDKLKQNADAYVTENNLLPEGYEYSGTSYITRQEVSEEGALGAVEQITGIVSYGRTLEGLKIVGPGSSICVLEGEDGAILGYTKVSRIIGTKMAKSSVKAPEKLKTMADKRATFELFTPEEAFKMLQERGMTSEIANVDTATVDKMYLAYYESEPNKKQVVAEPIYVFEGIATGPGGSVPYTEYMYALKDKNAKAPSQISDKQAEKGKERKTDEPPAPKGEKDPELI